MNNIETMRLALEAYLCREMPAGTIIGDPKWWVPKIANAIHKALAQQEQAQPDLKLMPRNATEEMLKAMDECSTEGYDERLYAGHASSVYTAAWDAFHSQAIEQAQQADKEGSPCPEFWDWLPKAYNFEGDGNFTKYNMEVAFLAGKQAQYAEQMELPEPRLTGTFSIRAGKFKCTGCTGTWTNREDAKHHSCKDYQ